MIRFMAVLAAVEVAISLAWFAIARSRSLPLAAALLALFCGAFCVWARRARRRAERELSEIARLRADFAEDARR